MKRRKLKFLKASLLKVQATKIKFHDEEISLKVNRIDESMDRCHKLGIVPTHRKLPEWSNLKRKHKGALLFHHSQDRVVIHTSIHLFLEDTTI